MTTTSTAVEQVDHSPRAMVQQYSDSFTAVLPSHIAKPETWIRLAQGALKKGRKGNDGRTELEVAAANNPAKFLADLLDCARLGLEPGTEQYYLTARKVGGRLEILGIVGYQGYIELMYRAGAISSVVAECVYANDTFHYQPGVDERPRHEIDWDAEDRGPLRLVYSYAVMKDGATSKVVVLNRAAIAKIKKSSPGSDSQYSPWQQHPDSMWLKSAVRQLAKWVPTSSEYMRQQLRNAREVAGETPAGGLEAAPGLGLDSIDPDPADVIVDVDLVGDDSIVDAEIVEADDDKGALLALMAATGKTEAQVVVIARRLAAPLGVPAPTSFDEISGQLLDAVCVELGGGPFDDGPDSGAAPEGSGPDGPGVVPAGDVELVDEGEEQTVVVDDGASIDRTAVGASAPAASGGNGASHHHREFFARAPRIAHHHGQRAEAFRRRLVGIYTGEATMTDTDGFTDAQWAELCGMLDRLDPDQGGEELYVRPSGVWTIRKPRGAAKAGAAA